MDLSMSQTLKLLEQLRKRQQANQQAQAPESIVSSSPANLAQTISRNEFNPLARNEPKTPEMLLACAKLFILTDLQDKSKFLWREFSEWLGGYEYIMPADRNILDDLAIALIKQFGYKKFYRLSFTIESNFSKTTQEGLLKWIRDLNN